MSERQARIKRKNAPQEEVQKKSKKSSVIYSIIATILVIAFLGLGGYALKDNIKALLPEKQEKETTVADVLKEKDMKLDEFLAEYGLTDSEVTKKTTETEMTAKMTVANYAKYLDKTVDELYEEYDVIGATEDMTWEDAQMLMSMSKVAEMNGMSFEELKEQAGFPDEITEKTTLKYATEIMEKLQAEQQADEQTEQATEENTAGTEAE